MIPEDQDTDHNNGSMTIGKQKTQQEDSREDTTTLLCTDGMQTNDIKNLNGISDGLKNIVDTWIYRQLLI